MKWLAIMLAAAALAWGACGDGDDDDAMRTVVEGFSATETTDGGSSGTPASGAGTTPGAVPTGSGTSSEDGGDVPSSNSKQYDQRPPMTIDVNKKYFATIKTEVGDIRIELFPQDAPETVNSFVFLSREGFYDGITFHRVIEDFVAQAGDPLGNGTGGPGYTVPDEVNARQFLDGTVGMAKTAAPNSAGSQFFLCYSPQPNLDGNYTVFGQIVEGRDVLNQIELREPSLGGAPGTRINTIEIQEQ
jgi:cyclophilin family peptidyl-prolyl cis-trans isomerase